MSKMLAGIAAQDTANYNAQVADQQGVASQQQGAAEEARIRHEARMAAGEAVAAQGASGFQIGTGSALDLLRENALNASLDQLTVRSKAENVRRGFKDEGHLQRASGRNAMFAGIVGTAEDAARAMGGGGG